MNRFFTAVTGFLFVFLISCSENSVTLYVGATTNNLGDSEAVFNSINDAINHAKSLKSNNEKINITIQLDEGIYRLNSPIQIDALLSGVSIMGKGDEKTIIKGSSKQNLTWEKFNENIWQSKVTIGTNIDQVILEGKSHILARYPNYDQNGGHWQGHAADAISPERVAGWKNPKGGIIHAMHSGQWGGFHYRIEGLNESGELILSGGHQNNRPSGMHPTYRMVENIFEELDSPGEWYFDTKKGTLYLWPVSGENPNDVEIELVNLKHLVEIVGTEMNPVRNVTFEGIKFEHTLRTFMEEMEPLLRSDWAIYRGGAVFIEGAKNINISSCEFSNLGGNAIFISNYTRNINIKGNHIHNIGASGISFVGDPKAVRSPSFQYNDFVPLTEMDTVKGPATNNYPSECLVDDNLIYRTGRVEKQTAGVQISMAMKITVSNNSIYEVPRAGINVSEGTWGGHIIEYNDVFNTVLETSDHGAFNSWGRDRFWHPNRGTLNEITSNNPQMPYWDAIHTTIIRNNRFRCDHGWDIDLDDGSSNYLIYNNVCLKGGIKLREGFYRTVENNILLNNSFHPHVWFENSGDIFRKNIVMTQYRDIRLSGWGDEVDFNLFPNEASLITAQSNQTDKNSTFGNPQFENPDVGDYKVKVGSPALKIGFQNFPMDNFGVKEPRLKKLAKSPPLPFLWSLNNDQVKKEFKMDWLGGVIKNIESPEEQSASGLNSAEGVLLVKVPEKSYLHKSQLQEGDVILEAEGKKIKKIHDLMTIYEGNNWKGRINLVIFRNQNPLDITLLTH